MRTIHAGGSGPLEGQDELKQRLSPVLERVFNVMEPGESPSREELLDCFTSHTRGRTRVVSPRRAERIKVLFPQLLAVEDSGEQTTVALQVARALYNIDQVDGGKPSNFNTLANIVSHLIETNGGSPASLREKVGKVCEIAMGSQSRVAVDRNMKRLYYEYMQK